METESQSNSEKDTNKADSVFTKEAQKLWDNMAYVMQLRSNKCSEHH